MAVAVGIIVHRFFKCGGDTDIVHHEAALIATKTRLTRAMACMRLCPAMGL